MPTQQRSKPGGVVPFDGDPRRLAWPRPLLGGFLLVPTATGDSDAVAAASTACEIPSPEIRGGLNSRTPE